MINVTKTYLPNLQKYNAYLKEIFQSGWVTNNGEMCKRLTAKLEQYLGVKNLVLVANGTLALQIAYKLLNLSEEVITTPFSFVATVSSMVWEGLTPVFADIDNKSFNISVKCIENQITNETQAIVPVHVFGNACDIQDIQTLAKKYKLKVIYDASHAFGVNYNSKSILSYGDVSTISFHATKLFHTIEGGALVIKDDKLYQKAKRMINFGYEQSEIKGLGINTKMNELQAAMGLCILDDIDAIIEKRKEVFDYYFSKLGSIVEFQSVSKKVTPNYSYVPVLFENEDVLISVVQKMNEVGVFPRRYFYPSLDSLSYLQNQYMPIARNISNRILCLPTFY
ncbi:MAG: DegT/DnrJ/EryC1/StrS family aminotransferase, partial [Chlorobi bacterium]|nr:DegT/DnrJ/EryC1/StrS family aminotransferase [Chlorobiota bacterium]